MPMPSALRAFSKYARSAGFATVSMGPAMETLLSRAAYSAASSTAPKWKPM